MGDGSSPLARGLRGVVPGRAGGRGIIPARAGFTAGCVVTTAGAGGSSPLARGLRAASETRRGTGGIIPARAGFTAPSPSAGPKWRDHPRSRGVYTQNTLLSSLYTGSSPLARGLLWRPRATGSPIRIIPARAGFTRRALVRGGGRRDHPRSRGVYCVEGGAPAPAPGSSPLARGLRTVADASAAQAGIIPARAGFTRPLRRATARARDHPRSRGVYSPPACEPSW